MQQNKHICIVMCPIPLIMFNWSTIRLSIGPPLQNIVWIIMVYRASVCPLCLAYVICSRSCMAPSTEYPPSADPVMHSFISIPLILQSPPDSPSRGANLLWTWLLHSAGKKQTLSIPGSGWAVLMCHAICMDWLMVALSSTHFCQHEQPLLELTRLLASVPTIPRMAVRVLCQNCWYHFEAWQLVVLLLKLTSNASEWDYSICMLLAEHF